MDTCRRKRIHNFTRDVLEKHAILTEQVGGVWIGQGMRVGIVSLETARIVAPNTSSSVLEAVLEWP